MSRSSAKIRDHAEKMPSESADLTTTQREKTFPESCLGGNLYFRMFPDLYFPDLHARAAGSYQSGPLRPR
jgi:hypothetical protein